MKCEFKPDEIMAQEQYNPQPEDLEHVRLPKSLNRLIDALAKNVHEVWAKKRMDEGWKYGVERNDKLKIHPGLVNYEDLTEEEKDYDRNTALSTLKFITKMGYKISTEKKSHCRFQNIWKRVVHWKPMRLLDRTLQGGIGKQLRILGLVVLGVYTIFFILAFFFSKSEEWNMDTVQESVSATQPVLQQKQDEDKCREMLWIVYNHFIDTGNQVSVHGVTRIWAILISLIGSVLVGGLLISTISNIMERRVERFRKGLVHYRMSGHYVIIGADAMLSGLVQQLFRKDPDCEIVIQTSKDVEDMRMKLFSRLERKYEKRVLFNYAHRDSREDLERMYIADAKEVFILGDSGELDDIEYYHDSLNVDCFNLIGQICKDSQRNRKYKQPLRCNMLFEYQSTYFVFQFSEIASEYKDVVELYPFNFYEIWARKVLVNLEADRLLHKKSSLCQNSEYNAEEDKIYYQPLDRIPILKHSEHFVHFVIVGMSRMGVAMAVEAAHIAHFPNFLRDKRKKTRITFVDTNASYEMDVFKQSYPHLFDLSYSVYIDAKSGERKEYVPKACYKHLGEDLLDIEWQFVQGAIETESVRSLIEDWTTESNALMTIAICLNLTHQAISAAMFLPECVRRENIPILVQQRTTSAIIDNLSGAHDHYKKNYIYKNIRPFGMLGECMDLMDYRDIMAKRANYAYEQIYAEDNNISPTMEVMDSLWQKLGREKGIIKQWSNIYHVSAIGTRLRSVGLNFNVREIPPHNIDDMAQVEHNRWNIEELLLGYRPVTQIEEQEILQEERKGKEFKEKKISELKKNYIHYQIRAYDQLSESMKLNDRKITEKIPFILTGKDL